MLLRKFNFFRHSQVKQIFDCRIFTFQNACDLLFCIVDTDVLESSGISRGLHVFDFRCHHICGCQWDQFRISFLSGSLVVFAVFHLTLKWQRNIALKQLHESKQLLNFSNYMKKSFPPSVISFSTWAWVRKNQEQTTILSMQEASCKCATLLTLRSMQKSIGECTRSFKTCCSHRPFVVHSSTSHRFCSLHAK